MPSILRSRLALFGILGVFLIPIVTTNLRGLTHILTCEGDAETPFTLEVAPDGGSTITSSQTIERSPEPATDDEPTPPGRRSLCGGLTLELAAGGIDGGDVLIEVRIHNGTEFGWKGSVNLNLEGIILPVDIGSIDAGETADDSLEISLSTGAHQLDGSLLIGP